MMRELRLEYEAAIYHLLNRAIEEASFRERRHLWPVESDTRQVST